MQEQQYNTIQQKLAQLKQFVTSAPQNINTPEIKQQLIALAYDPDPGSAEVLATLLKKDTTHWANVIKVTGIKAE
jgi:tripartite-type tricarboxylate transporter receptor subunit TctC